METGNRRTESTESSPTDPNGGWSPLSPAVARATSSAIEDLFDPGGGEPVVAIAVIEADRRARGIVRATDSSLIDRQVLLWSLTKTVLAAAVFRLIEDGRLTIEGRVRNLLPDAPVHPVATVRQLLSHTAAVPDYGSWPDYHRAVCEKPDEPWPLRTYLERARVTGPVAHPGERWSYSNIGYLVVRQIIERLTALPLSSVLHSLVIGPLGLRQTAVTLEPGDAGLLLFDAIFPDQPGFPGRAYHPGWVTHGLTSSTIAEAALLFDGILGGELLSNTALRAMTTPVVPVAAGTVLGQLSWAPGVLVGTGHRVGDVIGHTGGGPGSTTAALRITRSTGRTMTIATAVNNERENGAAELAMRVADAYWNDSEA